MNDRPYRVTGAFLDESAHEGELLVDGARYRVTEADYRSLGFAVSLSASHLDLVRLAMQSSLNTPLFSQHL